MGLFKQLFKDAQHGSENVIESFRPGEMFPHHDRQPKSNVVFLSLTCQDCIEVITAIQKTSTAEHNKEKINLVLYIVATVEEVKELDTYYNSSFTIYAITKKELVEKYKVPSTPYCYHTDQNHQVISTTEFDDVNSFMKMITAFDF
ncbi:hypothetical protein [Paenibacillus amylolyticus]|uniref:Uncharacterized protein n=1 Tax=Paenibacillus amylolyticus TaxID=1451 RepID=A0ABD8AUJ2_PAEAM